MPFNLLLLPLLGGYIFVNKFNDTKYVALRQDGHRLIFLSAFAGVVTVGISRIVVLCILHYKPEIGAAWRVYSPYPLSGTATGAFLIGCLAWIPLNKISPFSGAIYHALEKHGNLLENLLNRALNERLHIQVTMDDGKVYVGWVSYQPNRPQSVETYIGILPIISGYRDTETKEVTYTTRYDNIYEKLNSGEYKDLSEEDFVKYLPISKINCTSVFDIDVYLHFEENALPSTEEERSV